MGWPASTGPEPVFSYRLSVSAKGVVREVPGYDTDGKTAEINTETTEDRVIDLSGTLLPLLCLRS